MSVEQSVMRTMLLPGLLGAVRDNLDRLNEPPSLFELGKVYLWDDERRRRRRRTRPSPAPCSRTSPRRSASSSPARCSPRAGRGAGRETDFYTLKGVVERRAGRPGASAECGPRRLGRALPLPASRQGGRRCCSARAAPACSGSCAPDVAAAFGLEDVEVYVAELALRPRRRASAWPTPRSRISAPIRRRARTWRWWSARDVPAEDVVEVARRAGGKLVRSVRVFDVYEGDQVPPDKRSLALRVVMRSPERTLGEKDIASVRAKILAALEREFEATLRQLAGE